MPNLHESKYRDDATCSISTVQFTAGGGPTKVPVLQTPIVSLIYRDATLHK